MWCLGENGEKPATVESGELNMRRRLVGGMADVVSTSNDQAQGKVNDRF